MKFFKFAILAALIVFISSCKDDDNDCSQSAWIGTYTGVQDCDGTIESVTVNITASTGSDNDVDIEYIGSNSSLEYFDLTPDACEIFLETFVTLEISLDGNDLTYKTTFPSGASISVCNITATRN